MKGRVVTFHYVLKNKGGETLDSSREGEPLSFLEGSGEIITGLEAQLRKLKSGDKSQITVPAVDAYGNYDKALVLEVPRIQIPNHSNVQVGDQFRAGENAQDSRLLRVTKVTDSHVTMDANHPLAGEDLFFDVEVTAIRDATLDELKHGHVHGAGGHPH